MLLLLSVFSRKGRYRGGRPGIGGPFELRQELCSNSSAWPNANSQMVKYSHHEHLIIVKSIREWSEIIGGGGGGEGYYVWGEGSKFLSSDLGRA